MNVCSFEICRHTYALWPMLHGDFKIENTCGWFNMGDEGYVHGIADQYAISACIYATRSLINR